MKLYHVASYMDGDKIKPSDCGNKITSETTLQGLGIIGVYGFADYKNALEFAYDNNYQYDGFYICEFETGDLTCLPDPEYDHGISWLVITDKPLDVIEITECGEDQSDDY